MKRIIAILSLVALALTASPVFAKGPKMEHGLKLGVWRHLLDHHRPDDDNLSDSMFVLTGSVASAATSSLVVKVKGSVHVSNITDGQTTVNVDSNTIGFSDIKVGDQIVANGNVSGSTLTAANIRVIAPRGKAYGEVTSKTDTSITIKNNSTGTSQTLSPWMATPKLRLMAKARLPRMCSSAIKDL